MNEYYVNKANETLPKMYETVIIPQRVVEIVEDKNSWFGVNVKEKETYKQIFKTGDSVIFDFGQHCVGTITFNVKHVDKYLDAPVKIKLRFAEMGVELSRDFNDYRGELCASWLQEEIIYVDYPGEFKLNRRYSFRYVEMTILNTPREVLINQIKAKHTTSADISRFIPFPENEDELIHKIDCVGAKTLEDCMQSVYEDGPKRDRRLWIGDLRLQALTDYYLFENYNLVCRCLYLFASCFESGKYLPGCLYYEPQVFYDKDMELMDYALLYTVTLCEYYEHTQDIETAKELFDVSRNQLELAISKLDKNGIVTFPPFGNFQGSFIDWAPNIKTRTATHGVFLYALKKNIELANSLNETETAKKWRSVLKRTTDAAYDYLFDKEKQIFCNKYDEFQYSVHSQVWMILGGAVDKREGKVLLKKALKDAEIKPVTPYMHHYVVEAMFELGMHEEAVTYIKEYWGGMVKCGADTFWEVYVPEKYGFSAYGDNLIESFCHAWSCTPSYFIRKYLK